MCLALYYGFAQYLPDSYGPFGKWFNAVRVYLVKHIAKHAGEIDTINRLVYFGNGANLILGDHCGIGAGTSIPNDTVIGDYTIVSRDVFILHGNHKFDDPNIPIKLQGSQPDKQCIIEDDCWIGMRSYLTPGRHVKKGTIVAACSVLTKDFPKYSIVGGNPAKFLKSRLNSDSGGVKDNYPNLYCVAA